MRRISCLLALAASLAACDDTTEEPTPSPFELRFEAVADGRAVGCTDTIDGLGPDGEHSAGVSDLRFYVSNVRFYDADGAPVRVVLDEDAFQFDGPAGGVSLIDLTGNSDGTCASGAVAQGEGTARTHTALTGSTLVGQVASVAFDVGIPQPVMQAVIGETTAEAAPSPLNEMYWSWASGYRHFVFNFTVAAPGGEAGEGYVHVGSRDCGQADGKALEDRDACGFVNTPTVMLDGFDLAADRVKIDLRALLAAVDFVAPIYDAETFEVIGEGPGVSCHSSPMQTHCGPIFENLGVDMSDGSARPAGNHVFGR